MACDDVFPDPSLLDPFGQGDDSHLNTDGSNCMLGPLRIQPGTSASPGLQFCDDPQTGMWLKSSTELCFSVLGDTVFCLGQAGIEIWIGGYKATITHNNTDNRTYTLQDKDGTIAHLDDVSSAGADTLSWMIWSCGWG